MLPTSSIPSVFIFSFLIAFGAVISPGPVSTSIISQAPRMGWRVGPLVATGHSLMELVLVILILLGMGSSLANIGAQTAIAILGGILLAWMGGSMIWNTMQGKIHLTPKSIDLEPVSSWQLIGLGIIATISNPFWYIWWMTVAAGYLVQAQALNISSISAFYMGHVTADYAWDTVLSAVIGGGRQWMTDTLYRLLILTCGAFFIYLSWVFLAHGMVLRAH